MRQEISILPEYILINFASDLKIERGTFHPMHTFKVIKLFKGIKKTNNKTEIHWINKKLRNIKAELVPFLNAKLANFKKRLFKKNG